MSVFDFPVREKQICVKVLYAHWSGEHQVDASDSHQIVVIGYDVNGYDFSPSQMKLEFDTFAQAHIFIGDDLREIDPEMNEKNRKYHREKLQALRDTLTPSDWLEGTTEEDLYLPIACIEWIERP